MSDFFHLPLTFDPGFRRCGSGAAVALVRPSASLVLASMTCKSCEFSCQRNFKEKSQDSICQVETEDSFYFRLPPK